MTMTMRELRRAVKDTWMELYPGKPVQEFTFWLRDHCEGPRPKKRELERALRWLELTRAAVGLVRQGDQADYAELDRVARDIALLMVEEG